MKKAILVDGNNLLFRSYYATAYSGNVMKNSKGQATNALYGFINMMNKIIAEEKPEYIMVAFDKGKTFRHDKYESYKAGRSETPDDLIAQFPIAKQLIEAMGMKYFEIDNYEADDIIGTFAKKIDETEGFCATIISSDKDLLQLISDKIDMKLLKQTGFLRMDRDSFKETYGVEPIGMIDLKALMGDASDHIPGVKGIGEKTAIALLKEWKTLEQLYEHIEEIKGKTKEKLEVDKENAFMSQDLATIYREVPIDTELEHIKYDGIDPLRYVQMLEDLEFYSIIKKLDIPKEVIKGSDEVPRREAPLSVHIVKQVQDFQVDQAYAIYLEILGQNYHKDPILGIGVYSPNHQYFIPFEFLKEHPDLLQDSYPKYTYDLKKILVAFAKQKIILPNCNYDLMIAAYLLNYTLKDDVSYLANTMGIEMPFYEDVYGKNTKLSQPEEPTVAQTCVEKAKFIYDTKDMIYNQLEKEEAMYLFEHIEMPLVTVLSDMEATGIRLDQDFLKNMGEELKIKEELLQNEIFNLAGEEFNISSPKQLGIILFEKLGLPYSKKVKDGGYSTSKEILDKLAPIFPIVGKVLDYRTITKLQSNYVVGLLNEVASDGKIHTIFNQTLTRTGRLSSVSPNLQNIPIRLEYGRLIRKAFIPEENSFILSSDYSQIELRIFAHMSQAENLIQAFREDKDIHAKTAADIFGVEESLVTKDMRRTAKAVNFGILYGISSFGLSEDLGIDIGSAKSFMDTYLHTYPGIKEYMAEEIREAHEKGYVTTIMNRKRMIEELKNKNYMIRSQGERMALNTPIQGSSADILKKAMVEIYQEFEKRQLKSKMLIQVHDELVFNVVNEEAEEVKNIVQQIMEHTMELSVPLKVDIEFGKDWYQAK